MVKLALKLVAIGTWLVLASASEDLAAVVRRLSAPMPELSAACTSVCPGASSMMTSLQSVMSPFQPDPNAGVSDMTAMLSKMKSMIHCVYDFMCENTDTYKCLADNQDKCATDATNSGSSMGFSGDPAKMSNEMECLCSACPGSGPSYANIQFMVIELMMSAFAGLGGNNEPTPSPDEMAKTMYGTMCPMVSVMGCMASNSAVCTAVQQGLTLEGMADKSALEANCTAMDVSTAMVTSQCPSSGKMDSDTAHHRQSYSMASGLLGGLYVAWVAFL